MGRPAAESQPNHDEGLNDPYQTHHQRGRNEPGIVGEKDEAPGGADPQEAIDLEAGKREEPGGNGHKPPGAQEAQADVLSDSSRSPEQAMADKGGQEQAAGEGGPGGRGEGGHEQAARSLPGPGHERAEQERQQEHPGEMELSDPKKTESHHEVSRSPRQELSPQGGQGFECAHEKHDAASQNIRWIDDMGGEVQRPGQGQ